jgi:hypothetical protein
MQKFETVGPAPPVDHMLPTPNHPACRPPRPRVGAGGTAPPNSDTVLLNSFWNKYAWQIEFSVTKFCSPTLPSSDRPFGYPLRLSSPVGIIHKFACVDFNLSNPAINQRLGIFLNQHPSRHQHPISRRSQPEVAKSLRAILALGASAVAKGVFKKKKKKEQALGGVLRRVLCQWPKRVIFWYLKHGSVDPKSTPRAPVVVGVVQCQLQLS